MATATVDSFSLLVAGIQRESHHLVSLSALRPSVTGAVVKGAELHELEEVVSSLEDRMNELSAFVSSEAASLEIIEAVAEAVRDQALVAQHLEENLPRSLPGNLSGTSSRAALAPVPQASADPAPSGKTVAKNTACGLATHEELMAVPATTRERSTLDEINLVLASLNSIIASRHSMLATERSAHTGKMREKWAELQVLKKSGHLRMISEDDLNDLPVLNKAPRGKSRSIVTTLRHLGRLQMHSSGGKTSFMVV